MTLKEVSFNKEETSEPMSPEKLLECAVRLNKQTKEKAQVSVASLSSFQTPELDSTEEGEHAENSLADVKPFKP